jgi:coenzyme F420-dependent glucose-6-phosphate dehydrogenase
MPVTLGFHCSHEQHPPSALLRYVVRAENAGLCAAMCSDHFRPWSVRQGQSGFAWSWMGAAMQATSMSYGTVCAPGQRYHPAVIAQAAATLSEMFPQRFWLAVGSGEALNESVTGESWPPKAQRNARLRASAEMIRALWAGETVTVNGLVKAEKAKLYSRPQTPPLLLGAALTPETAEWMGGWVDGLITVAGPRQQMRDVVDAFRAGGGVAKPVWLQAVIAYAPTHEQAAAAAFEQWRHCVAGRDLLGELPTVEAFDQACATAAIGDVLQHVRASADIQQHVEWLLQDAELGYERVYLHNVARDEQERFIDACAEWLLPALS